MANNVEFTAMDESSIVHSYSVRFVAILWTCDCYQSSTNWCL